jgi:hypothetical protein
MPVNPLTRLIVGALFGGGLSLAMVQPCRAQQAPALQPLDSVRAAAERALRDELAHVPGVQLTAVALDPRLRLAACGSRLETQATPPRGNQARSLVRVACSQGANWTVNVPVEIRREVTVFVVRRSLARGEPLLAADVMAQKRVLRARRALRHPARGPEWPADASRAAGRHGRHRRCPHGGTPYT